MNPITNELSALSEKIQASIAAIDACAHRLPAHIIIHNLRDTSVVYMSAGALRFLGVTMDELKAMGPAYHDRFFNPDDAKDYVPKILGLVERNNNDETISFFQQVRPSAGHEWTWHLSSIKIFMRDDQGLPLLTITFAIPIDTEHYFTAKIERLLQENSFLKRHQPAFAALTQRERTILKLMALGKNSSEIATNLHISEKTAATHRRNIKRKLNAQNAYDITLFAQAFDLI